LAVTLGIGRHLRKAGVRQIASVHEVTGTGGGSLGITDTWLHYDHIGNVMNTSTSTGALGTTYNQDAWGNVLSSASTGAWASTFDGRHLTTKEYDPDAGLHYFWHRWYDSKVGLFASLCPLPPYSEHPYAISMGNPVTFSDPEGREAGSDFACACRQLCDYIKKGCKLGSQFKLYPDEICKIANFSCGLLCKTIIDSSGHTWCKINLDSCRKGCEKFGDMDYLDCVSDCNAAAEECHKMVRKAPK